MAFELSSLQQLHSLPFDEVIDVRSPAEFAEDHIPGAINLPVLSNEERARVGTIYTQDSPFTARKLGAALVARNAAQHLEDTLCARPKGYRPLVYCWRGGQRSGSFAVILRQIGWQAETIDGGYRQYRRMVQHSVYDHPFPAPVILLDGNTGTAKSRLLGLLRAEGQQVIDLEALAHHRGSLFGGYAGGQPSQKAFESALANAITGLNAGAPVWVEAESSKIGRINLPPSLWSAMCAAPRVTISAPIEARAAFLVDHYGDIATNPARMQATLAALAPFHAAAQIEAWQDMAQTGAFAALAAELMTRHYDPLYQRQRARFETGAETRVHLNGLGAANLTQAVAKLQAAAETLMSR